MKGIEERVEALESRLDHGEKALSDISAEVFGLSRKLDRMELLLKQIAGKVKEFADHGDPAPGNQRPPHW